MKESEINAKCHEEEENGSSIQRRKEQANIAILVQKREK